MTIYIGSPYWPRATIRSKQKVIAHEFFHIVQQDLGWSGVLIWLVEGSAEYVGYAYRAVQAAADYVEAEGGG